MKNNGCLFIIILLVTNSIFSQKIWKKVESSNFSNNITTKLDIPNYNLFTLNIDILKKILLKAPTRKKLRNKSNTIVNFPNANGELENFEVFKASVFHPDLALKYPNINSYVGYGIDDPTATIRFSVSHKGLHTMKLSGKENVVFIAPYSNNKVYTVYQKNNKKLLSKTFECRTKNIESRNSFNTPQRRDADDGLLRVFRLAVSVTGEYTEHYGGTVADALAGINTTITRVNGIYEKDFGITMQLIANTDMVIYTDSDTDPYPDGFGLNEPVQLTLTSVIWRRKL